MTDLSIQQVYNFLNLKKFQLKKVRIMLKPKHLAANIIKSDVLKFGRKNSEMQIVKII